MKRQGFPCSNCERGTVVTRQLAGRKAVALPGVEVVLPEDLALPTCDYCLDYTVPEDREQEVADAVEQSLMNWQKRVVAGWVSALSARYGITRKRIATALDVTPEYLSNVTAGTKKSSLRLLRLLRAFVVVPEEFVHALESRPLEQLPFEGMTAAATPWKSSQGRITTSANLEFRGRALTPPGAFAIPLPSEYREQFAHDAARPSIEPPTDAAAAA